MAVTLPRRPAARRSPIRESGRSASGGRVDSWVGAPGSLVGISSSTPRPEPCPPPIPRSHSSRRRRLLVERTWITEEMRTNLWLVPGLLVLGSIVLFAPDLRLRPRRLPERVDGATLDRHRRGRRRPPGAHRPGRRRHHRGRRGVLGDHRGPDPGPQPVRAAHAAQLHPRPGHPGDPGRVRGHLRVPDPGPGLDRHAAPTASSSRTCRSPWARCWSWAICWCSSTSSTTWPPPSSCPG